MDYNIEFQICAQIMMVLIVCVFFSKKRYPALENRIYGYMILAAFFVVASDIVSVITLATPDKFPVLTVFLGHMYLAFLFIFITALCMYVTALAIKGTVRQASVFQKLCFFGWPLIGAAAVIASCVLKLYAFGYGRFVYTTGAAVTFGYVVRGVAVAYILIYTLCNRKSIRMRQQIPIYGYVFVEVIMTIVQQSNRYLHLSSFVMAIVMFYMYFTLENPDLKLIEDLNAAKEEAERANQAKTSFLATMSHEFRTPINAILGMDEMILREADSREIKEYAANIQKAGRSLLTLVNDVLDFSKIESGKMELLESDYEMSVLITDVCNFSKSRAEEKGIRFHVQVEEDVPAVMNGDVVFVKQALLHLLSNAIKYTQQGDVGLHISAQKIAANTVCLYVEVTDTGCGITGEEMQKMQDAFAWAEKNKNSSMEGLGLGLDIVQNILSMMQSTLLVSSRSSEGATFSFELLQKVVDWTPYTEYEAQKPEAMTQEASGEEDYLWAPEAKVLVTDDNAMNLSVIKGLLKRTGIQLSLASSGKETIEKLWQEQYDVVMLDHMMPEMDGIETFRTIRMMWERREALETRKQTPFIVLTANAVVGAREMYLREGFTDYLSKPVDAAELEAILRKYLPKRLLAKKPKEIQEKREAEQTAEHKTAAESSILTEITYDKETQHLMVVYFTAQSAERRKRLLEYTESGNVAGLRILMRELARNAREMGNGPKIRAFMDYVQSMEQEIREGQLDRFRQQIPAFEKMWTEVEKGVSA